MKKYELTDDTITLSNGNKIRRIKALVDLGNDVKAGDLGGYIEKEANLSHSDLSWVYNDAKVAYNAMVADNAMVFDNAWVFGNAQVYDNAHVYNDAKVYDDARVYDNAYVSGDAQIYGDARVYGDASVYYDARVSGYARVDSDADYFCITPIGSRDSSITFYRTKTGIDVCTGCFKGTLDEFMKQVNETHGYNDHGQIYRLLIKVAKFRIKVKKEEQQ